MTWKDRWRKEIFAVCKQRDIPPLSEKEILSMIGVRWQSLGYEFEKYGFQASWNWDKVVVETLSKQERIKYVQNN